MIEEEIHQKRELFPKKKGIHNWRNLFKKPTFQDWIVFMCLLFVLFIAWAYLHDRQQFSNTLEYLADNPEVCYTLRSNNTLILQNSSYNQNAETNSSILVSLSVLQGIFIK